MADEEKIILDLEAEDKASDKIDNVTKSIRNLEKESNGIGNIGSDIEKVTKGFEDIVTKVNNVTRHYNNAMSGLNRTVINSVQEMGSAIYDFTSDAINNFTELSEQHAKTLGAMAADYDNTAQSQAKFFEDAQKLKDQAIQIGTFGVNGQGALMNVTEVSEAQTELIKAGVSADDIVDPNKSVTSDVLTFAQANDLTTEQAVEFAVTLGNQFNIDQADWGSMLDKVSHTADMSIIDVSDIVQSMKYAGGITSGLNRDLEETLGMISVLGDFGLKGSQGGSGIQALLTRLLTGDTTVITEAQAEVAPPKALEAFYDFSTFAKSDGSNLTYDQIANAESYEDLGDLSGNLRPMDEVVDQLDQVMGELNDEEQAWFAKKFFGLYQMKSAYALINGDSTDLDSVIKEIEEQSDGTNENKLEQLLQSQYGQLTSLNNLWEGIKTDVGDRLSPFTNAVRDELYAFLQNDGNYNINFDNLRGALDESCDLIEEKYGSAIANAVRGLGDVTIDLGEVLGELGPIFGEGALEALTSLFEGDIFGENGAISDWNTMVDNLYEGAEKLPEDLQDLGTAVAGAVDWFGKLVAFNAASEIAELISSVLQILTIAGNAFITASNVVVNGGTTGGVNTGGSNTGGNNSGSQGSQVANSTNKTKVKLDGSTNLGTADDVAKAFGTTADDVVKQFGEKASYSIDDIATGLGISSNQVISKVDELAQAGAITLDVVDDAANASKGLFSQLSKTGKTMGVLGTLWQLGSTGYEIYQDASSGDTMGAVEAAGGGAMSMAGSWGLAKLGFMVHPALGIGGAIIGGIAGDDIGRKIDDVLIEMTDYSPATEDNPEYNALEDMYRIYVEEYSRVQEGYMSDEDKETLSKWADVNGETIEAFKQLLINNNSGDKIDLSFMKGMDMTTVNALFDTVFGESSIERYRYFLSGPQDFIGERKFGDDELKHYQYQFNQHPELLDILKEIEKNSKENDTQTTNVTNETTNETTQTTTTENIENTTNINTTNTNTTNNTSALPTTLPTTLPRNKPIGFDLFNPPFKSKQQENKPFVGFGLDGTLTANNLTINSQNSNLTGDVQMPSIDDLVKKFTPGWAVLTDKGKEQVIENEINNQLQIDNSLEMKPSFTVSAPNVQVDVKVDKFGNPTVSKQILNPAQGMLLDNWYSRSLSQFGRTSK